MKQYLSLLVVLLLFLAGNGTPVGEFKIRAELFRDLIAAISKEARYVQRLKFW